MAHGYQTLALGDARAAVKALRRHSPAVAVIDLTLRDVSGLKLAREIKEASPETECIVLTGYASQESPIAAVGLGAYSCVQKPYDLDQSLLNIRTAREEAEAQGALREWEERCRLVVESARTSPHIWPLARTRNRHTADRYVAATDHQLP